MPRHWSRSIAADHAHIADGSGLENFDQFRREWVQPVHMGLAEKDTGFAGRRLHGFGLRRGKAYGFLAQDVLAVVGQSGEVMHRFMRHAIINLQNKERKSVKLNDDQSTARR